MKEKHLTSKSDTVKRCMKRQKKNVQAKHCKYLQKRERLHQSSEYSC